MDLSGEIRTWLLQGEGFGVICPPSADSSRQTHVFRWNGERYLSAEQDELILEPFDRHEHKNPGSDADRHSHETLVAKAIEAIRAGKMEKVVLSRTLSRPSGDFDEWIRVFRVLQVRYPAAMVYFLSHPVYGIWMGATPEILVSRTNGKYRTMALAGTHPSGPGHSEWSEKEKHEHEVVVRDLTGKLERAGAGGLRVHGPQEVMAGPVTHLRTDMEFDSDMSPVAMAGLLHPTPAICGWPEHTARQFISDEEPHARELYTGYLGIVRPNGDAQIFVNLRCMKLTEGRYRLFVGGGITGDSIPSREWEETEVKAQTLLSALK